MKKIALVIITFLLMINLLIVMSYAENETNNAEQNVENAQTTTEESAPSVENTQETVEEAVPIEENKTEYFEVKAKVLEVSETKEVEHDSITDLVQEVTVEILEGDYDTQEFKSNYVLSYDLEGKIVAYELEKGDVVWVQLAKAVDGTVTVEIENIVRQNYLYLMLAIFLLSIILVGGKRGIKAILGLLVTGVAVSFILIKGVFAGYNPIGLSIITSLVIIVLTFLIIGGINKKIITAAIGTFGGVLVAGIIASIFSYILKLSGAGEDAIQLSVSATHLNFNFRDLIFAGIVISALGACMDVGMSIASSLDELKNKTKDMDWKELFKSGMNIGKDIIGTMANTLILAYVGGSLTLILLFMACDFNFVQILNKETIAQEIISAIAGSMGVVYTVPITAFVYSFLNKDKVIYKTQSENKVDGKRSLKL